MIAVDTVLLRSTPGTTYDSSSYSPADDENVGEAATEMSSTLMRF